MNGLRSLLKKNPRALDDVASRANADVLVLQETKLGIDGAAALAGATFLTEYAQRAYATSSARKGYSGVAVFVRDGARAGTINGTRATTTATGGTAVLMTGGGGRGRGRAGAGATTGVVLGAAGATTATGTGTATGSS